MSLATTRYEHLVLDENGVPFVHATDLKVVELVLEQRAHGWSAEELHFQHPFLSLGQIHSALAYYWDHKDELDQNIEIRLERVNQIRDQTELPPLVGRTTPDAIYLQNAAIDTAVSGNVVSSLLSSVTHLTCRSSARDMYSAS